MHLSLWLIQCSVFRAVMTDGLFLRRECSTYLSVSLGKCDAPHPLFFSWRCIWCHRWHVTGTRLWHSGTTWKERVCLLLEFYVIFFITLKSKCRPENFLVFLSFLAGRNKRSCDRIWSSGWRFPTCALLLSFINSIQASRQRSDFSHITSVCHSTH